MRMLDNRGRMGVVLQPDYHRPGRETKEEREARFAAIRAKIVDYVASHPGATTSEISREALDGLESWKQLQNMEEAGIVRFEHGLRHEPKRWFIVVR